jgi:predicted metal-dependent hydrolase
MPAAFVEGVRRFNRGDYFEAHEAFEALLDEVEGDRRWDLLVALVQLAVAYHKAASGHPGDVRMLGMAAEKLARFAPVAWGVAVEGLRRRAAADLAAVGAGGSLAGQLAAGRPRIELRAGGAETHRRD